MKRTRDREIPALSILVKTLRPLDSEARKRAIDYALKRLEEEDKETAGDLTQEERWRRFGNTPPKDATLLSPRNPKPDVAKTL